MGNQTCWGPFRRGREGYSNMTTEVVVLMGGRSSEREVSIMSGVAVSESLRDNGYNVTKIDFQNGDLLLEQLVKKSPDVIFNALHGSIVLACKCIRFLWMDYASWCQSGLHACTTNPLFTQDPFG